MPDAGRQTTLAARTGTLRGKGLHSGRASAVALVPAEAGSGLVFRRADIPGSPPIPAALANVVPVPRCTALGAGGVTVGIVEHVLAACVLAGLDNASIEVEGEEVPAADGSAAPFLDMIRSAGIAELAAPRAFLEPAVPVELSGGTGAGWSFRLVPGARRSYSFRFRGGGSLDGSEAAYEPGRDDPRLVAPARTFCFEAEIAGLLERGLGRGGNAESVLVLSSDGTPLNPVRVPLEPARHKLLDLIGDMALAGLPIRAGIAAEGTGHAAHAAILKEILPGLIRKEDQ